MDGIKRPIMGCPVCNKPVDCTEEGLTNTLRCDDCIEYIDESNCKRSELLSERNSNKFCKCTIHDVREAYILSEIENTELKWRLMKLEMRYKWRSLTISRVKQ